MQPHLTPRPLSRLTWSYLLPQCVQLPKLCESGKAGRTREYQFRELAYEVIPATRVQDSDFTPEPELVSLRSGLSRRSDHRAP